jgi:hypothetical protein
MGSIPYAFRLWVSIGGELEFDGGCWMGCETEEDI